MGTFVSKVKNLVIQNEGQKTLSSIIINYCFHGLFSKNYHFVTYSLKSHNYSGQP